MLLAGFVAAAVAVPNHLAALDCPTATARAEIQAVGSATLAWLTDIISAVQADPLASFAPICPDSPPLDVALVPPIHAQILAIFLVPDYIAAVPLDDPWGNPYDYRLNVGAPLSADVIAIRSSGSDHVFEGTVYPVGPTEGPADDLVFYNDSWVRDVPRLDPVSRQQVTMEQVHRVGDALFSWIIENVSAFSAVAVARELPIGLESVDMANYEPIPTAELSAHLTTAPYIYTRCVPAADGWGTPYDYRLNDNLLGFHVASIRSLGADATADSEIYPVATFPADQREQDIVWADGIMAREPDASGGDIFLADFESGGLWGTWSCGPGF